MHELSFVAAFGFVYLVLASGLGDAL